MWAWQNYGSYAMPFDLVTSQSNAFLVVFAIQKCVHYLMSAPFKTIFFFFFCSQFPHVLNIRVVLRVGIITCGSCTPCELCILTVFWVHRELRHWNVLASPRPCQPHSSLAGKPLQRWQWMHFGLYPWKFSEDFKRSTIMGIVNTKTKQQKHLNTPWN